MKKITILAIALLGLQSCIYVKSGDGNGSFFTETKATGPITDRNYDISFSSIHVATGIDAEVYKSDQEKVIISAPSDIQDKILVENVGGQLYVHFKSGIRFTSNKKVKAKIYAKNINAVKASSSADIVFKDKFTQEKMDLSASSSGSINGDFEANDLSAKASSSGTVKGGLWAINATLEASSSGDVVVSGKAKTVTSSCSSSGTVNAKDLVTENASLQASSSGDVSITVSKQAAAIASSSGDIVIYKNGNPNITKSTSSSGSVSVR